MKLYFEEGHELPYTLAAHKEALNQLQQDEMVLIEAKPFKEPGLFWCREYEYTGDVGECGRTCRDYEPRNGKSGCCKHYTNTFYEPDPEKKIILKA